MLGAGAEKSSRGSRKARRSAQKEPAGPLWGHSTALQDQFPRLGPQSSPLKASPSPSERLEHERHVPADRHEAPLQQLLVLAAEVAEARAALLAEAEEHAAGRGVHHVRRRPGPGGGRL